MDNYTPPPKGTRAKNGYVSKGLGPPPQFAVDVLPLASKTSPTAPSRAAPLHEALPRRLAIRGRSVGGASCSRVALVCGRSGKPNGKITIWGFPKERYPNKMKEVWCKKTWTQRTLGLQTFHILPQSPGGAPSFSFENHPKTLWTQQ